MPSAELESVMALLRQTGGTLGADVPVADQRAHLDLLGDAFPPGRDVALADVDAGGVRSEWVVAPGAQGERAVLYLHGGGYVSGSVRSHRHLAAAISASSRARVLVAEYRLAPEHPFPAALEDACAAYRWMRAGRGPGAVPGGRVAVAGDSAGGGLAIATLMRLRDDGDLGDRRRPVAAVCLSPWVDLTNGGSAAVTKAAEDPVLTREGLDLAARHYLAGHDPRDPAASPLFGNLAGLPPLLVQVGSAEILLDDALRLAEVARRAGVDAELEVYEGCFHVFQAAATLVPEAADAVARIGTFLDAHLG